jgi:Fe2+ or Zn2+ uptake regulation protein
MICTECGKVIEFFSAELEAMQDAMAEKYNFKPTHHSLRILGVCEDCREKTSSTLPESAQPRVRVAAGKIVR